jgi:hypothetical protein
VKLALWLCSCCREQFGNVGAVWSSDSMGELITDFAAEVIKSFVAADASNTLTPAGIMTALFHQPTAAASTTASSYIRATQLQSLQQPSIGPFYKVSLCQL